MKISIIGSIYDNQEEAKIAAGRFAGVCYMKDNFEKLRNEDSDKTLARADKVLMSGHHSVYDHITYNLLIEGIPKILAMVLNNEGLYTTSEKSARYTKMNVTKNEENIYNRWLANFNTLISELYGEKILDFYGSTKKADIFIEKLSMENARYTISVFTPTTMVYTVSLRQLNYLISFFENYIREVQLASQKALTLVKVPFHLNMFDTLVSEMREFIALVPEELKIPELNANSKMRTISLFKKDENFSEYFGDVYSTHYRGTWAQFAQAQRHRTIHYQLLVPEEFEVYTPPILATNQTDKGLELQDLWKKDLESVSASCPQGMLVDIYERGTRENFILKCYERICGCAQLEIEQQTRATLEKYQAQCPNLISSDYFKGARCTFPGFKCENRCVWGAKEALERVI